MSANHSTRSPAILLVLATLVLALEFTPAAAQETAKKPAPRTMRVTVLDMDNQPLAGVSIHASVWTKEPFKANRDYTTDANGRATVELPQTIDILRLWATKAGHVGLFAQWWPDMQPDGHLVPEEYVFGLLRGTVIGGQVKNDAGQPIRGAKVQARLVMAAGVELRERSVPDTWLAYGDAARVTDADGRWSLDNVPEGDDVKVLVMLSHPDYLSESKWGDLQTQQHVTMASLRDKSAIIVMHAGIPVTGTVRDGNGKPITGAVVVWGHDPYFEQGSQEVRTDAEGRYRLPPREIGPLTVTVIARGWSPDQKTLDLSPANSTVDFNLKAGKTARIKFVDFAGAAVPKVAVGIEKWRGNKALYNHKHPNVLDTGIPIRADDNGIYEWTWAPDDEVVYIFAAEGYAYVREHPLAASGETIVVELRR